MKGKCLLNTRCKAISSALTPPTPCAAPKSSCPPTSTTTTASIALRPFHSSSTTRQRMTRKGGLYIGLLRHRSTSCDACGAVATSKNSVAGMCRSGMITPLRLTRSVFALSIGRMRTSYSRYCQDFTPGLTYPNEFPKTAAAAGQIRNGRRNTQNLAYGPGVRVPDEGVLLRSSVSECQYRLAAVGHIFYN